MAEKEVILALAGGLQTDESVNNPPPANRGVSSYEAGDYRYALNVRIGSSIADNVGAGENILSSKSYGSDFADVPAFYVWNVNDFFATFSGAGAYTAIGKYEDIAEGRLYWAVYDPNGTDHRVLMWSKKDRRVYEMLKWSGLNFDPAYPVQMCKIGKFLILVDRLNPNRVLNVNFDYNSPGLTDTTQIYRYKQNLGANFSEYHISFAKWPPLAPIEVTRILAGTSEYLEKGIFQFTYRYIYKGGFRSTFAPFSPFITNEGTGSTAYFQLNIPGFFFDYETPANTSFQHSSVKFYEAVDYIEFAYRESTRDPWKLFKRHKVTSSAPIILFENNGPTALIPSIDIDQYFDSVPFLSGSCESIDSRVMFADNLDELPAVTNFDVENIEVYSVAPSSPSGSWNGPSSSFSSLTGPQQTQLNQKLVINQKSFKERAVYKLGIIFQHYNGRTNLVTTLDKWTYIIPASAASNVVENYHALGFNIPSGVTPPEWAVAYQIVRSNALKIDAFVHGVANDFKFLAKDANGLNDFISTPDDIKNQQQFGEKITWAEMIQKVTRKNKTVTTIDKASRIYIDISNWYLTSSKDDPPTQDWPANSVYYNYQKGDRVRFRGSRSASYSASDLSIFDEEIVDFTGNGIIVNKPSDLVTLKTRSDATPNPSQSYIIEIYRPSQFNSEQSIIFHEMGEWYPITQPTTSSRDFSKRDFRWTSNSAVTQTTLNGFNIYHKMPISCGDVWMVPKDFYFDKKNIFSGQLTGYTWPQMTQDKDRSWDYWERNTGRPLAAFTYLPSVLQKETQVRFGGKFLEDSLFVSINNFREFDQKIYPSEYGRIRKMVNTSNAQVESVGSILLSIGEVEAWSIYVNRTTLEDLSGSTTVQLSDKVLGSYNTLLGRKGTLNPESVSVANGRVVWWNQNGEWIRYSRDGMTEISDVGMKNWFKDLSDLLINEYESTTPKVLSTFDDYHKCWMTYIHHANLPATFKGYSSYKCVTFAERNADKRWKEFFDYAPELFASLNNEVYSIIGINVHIHEAGDNFGSIYGVKKDSYIELIANPEVRKNKAWKSVALESSDEWSFESVKGDWRSNDRTQQDTRMRVDDLQKKEWTFWTNIKRDKNTPNAASEQAGVVNGENMRSKSLRILMKLDPSITYYSIFNYLVVTYDDSPLNPKN